MNSGALIVTTGQKAAVDVAIRGISMFKKLNVPIIGIIDNMSGLKCSNCSHINKLFGNTIQELALNEGCYIYTCLCLFRIFNYCQFF